MKLNIKWFSELTAHELYEIVVARTEIFLLEQKIICQDFDRVDYDSLHCFLEEDGKIMAYLRAYRDSDGEVMIGRVLSIEHGIGLGRKLINESVPEIKRLFDAELISLHAQKQAIGFYEKLGFAVISAVFMEEGIPHVTMRSENI